MYFVYILRCADDALYIGHTSDLARRVETHQAGEASRFTANRRPVALTYSESFPNRAAAVKRERQLKRWTRRKKDALISGNLQLLQQL